MLQLLDELTTNPWRDTDLLNRSLSSMFPNFRPLINDSQRTPLRVLSNEDHVKVVAFIPGWQADWFDIAVEGNTLHIKGLVPEDAEAVHVLTNKFERVVRLPFRAEAERVKAAYKNGVLTIALEKQETDKPRKITIQAV